MRSPTSLSRSNKPIFLSNAKTSDISFMLAVDLLLVGRLIVDDHFVADRIESDRSLKRNDGLLDLVNLNSIDPVEFSVCDCLFLVFWLCEFAAERSQPCYLARYLDISLIC